MWTFSVPRVTRVISPVGHTYLCVPEGAQISTFSVVLLFYHSVHVNVTRSAKAEGSSYWKLAKFQSKTKK